MQHTKCYKKDYPRPQFVRNNWMNLNGTWDFVFDDEDVGMEKKYYKNFPTSQTILVPFSYQTAKSGIHDETQHFIVWYAKKQHFEKLKKNERYLLHFEALIIKQPYLLTENMSENMKADIVASLLILLHILIKIMTLLSFYVSKTMILV